MKRRSTNSAARRPDRGAAGRILAVNVGNTTTAVARMAGERIVRRVRLPTSAATPSVIRRLLRTLRAGPADSAVLASVVPSADSLWMDALAEVCGGRVVRVDATCDTGVPLRYPRPRTLGADRLANLAGARRPAGRPVIVVDAGTATTFDAIDARGVFLGGVIAPGPGLLLESLAARTAKLPRLRFAPERAAVGRSTDQAMRIGASAGFAGMVREILARMRAQPRLRRARVIACGGAAALVARAAPGADIDPDVTFRGLSRILARAAQHPARTGGIGRGGSKAGGRR